MEAQKCSSCVKEPTETINITRFIDRLDACFAKNDLAGAEECICYWKKEAENLKDRRGLLSVVNEELGFYRRTGNREKARAAVCAAGDLLEELGMTDQLSGATIMINLATTDKFCGRPEEAVPWYERAAAVYEKYGREKTYEYAALLNNKASSLCDLERYEEGEDCYHKAIAILEEEGKHDGEIAVSYLNLAHLIFDRDGEAAYDTTETLIDKAWEYLNSPRQPHDSNYAFILSKCAPDFKYFQRPMEAKALKSISREIYAGN